MIADSYLNKSVNLYLKYAKGIINDKIKVSGFPVNSNTTENNFNVIDHIFNKTLPNFSNLVSVLSNQFNNSDLYFYSLQNPYLDSHSSEEDRTPRKFWKEKTLEVLFENGKEEKVISGLFVFLFDSLCKDNVELSEEYFDHNNSIDEQFCHSLFLRDFVDVNKIGFDFDLSIKTKTETQDFSEISYLDYKISQLLYNKDQVFFYNKVNSIIAGFNNYFSLNKKNKLKKDIYCKYITDFYAYNLNCKAFKDAKSDDIIVEEIKLSEVDSGHDLYGSVVNEMKKDDKTAKKDIAKLSKWFIYVNMLSSFTKTLIYYRSISKKLEILLIDDHPDKISKEINVIEKWIGSGAICNKENEELSVNKINQLFDAIEYGRLTNDESVDKILKKIIDIKHNGKSVEKYDFIIIDLDYNGELKGFEYLRKLRKAKTIYSKPYVIVFTRNEDPKSVQKALNMGALFVASKQNVAHLILEIYKVLPLVCKTQSENPDYSLGHNWSLLYQLPLSRILDLKTSKICGTVYKPFEEHQENYGFIEKEIAKDKEYLWIKKLPKAELHCHIGSVLGPELIPQTALLVLAKYYSKINEGTAKLNRLKLIIDFLLPIADDPFLNECDDEKQYGKFIVKGRKNKRYGTQNWYKLKETFVTDVQNQFYNQSIFTIVSDSLNLKAHKKTPEEVLLSPEDDVCERYFKPFSRLKKSKYFDKKLKLREKNISYDEVILFFILLLNIRDRISQSINVSLEKVVESIINKITKAFDLDDKILEKNKLNKADFKFPKSELDVFKNDFINVLKEYKNVLKINFGKNKTSPINILEFLISAHSKQRCLTFDNRGLFNYLRGCEYGGAPHLQCKESIFLVAHHIIFNYAIPDNIRYLDLRCAIDGYNKFKLFDDTKEAIEISGERNALDKIVDDLNDSFSYWQQDAYQNKKKKVHINLIVTAKRHKSLKEFEKNVELTVKNFTLHNSKEFESNRSFFDIATTEIVSFDLAGLEKNNRISKFKDQIVPLLEKCVPITMHAGEEDSHEAIWEAFYLGHAQRIGHALSLEDSDELKNLIRESFVNIELCPISNYLTNNKYVFDKGTIKKYPLKKYLEDRLSISINTDNPFVSNSTLTKEFIFASKMYGGLTKWQILKLILYSFKSVTIHKNLKSILLKEINEEIYELILNEGE